MLEAEKSKIVVVFQWGPSSWFIAAGFSLFFHVVEGPGELCGLFYKDKNLIYEGATPMP